MWLALLVTMQVLSIGLCTTPEELLALRRRVAQGLGTSVLPALAVPGIDTCQRRPFWNVDSLNVFSAAQGKAFWQD